MLHCLDCSVRLERVLHKINLSFEDIAKISPEELLKERNFGKVSLLELCVLMKDAGIVWPTKDQLSSLHPNLRLIIGALLNKEEREFLPDWILKQMPNWFH